jgi:thiamine pyrophosphate-dependent acetolactate synthase large subunit-like protein
MDLFNRPVRGRRATPAIRLPGARHVPTLAEPGQPTAIAAMLVEADRPLIYVGGGLNRGDGRER